MLCFHCICTTHTWALLLTEEQDSKPERQGILKQFEGDCGNVCLSKMNWGKGFGEANFPGCSDCFFSLSSCCASWCCSQCSPTTGIFLLISSTEALPSLVPPSPLLSVPHCSSCQSHVCADIPRRAVWCFFHSSSQGKLEGLAVRQEGEGSGKGVGTSQGRHSWRPREAKD